VVQSRRTPARKLTLTRVIVAHRSERAGGLVAAAKQVDSLRWLTRQRTAVCTSVPALGH